MFVYDMSTGITRILNPYVTSAFEEHSLTATTSVISSFAGGIFQIPYSKLIDVWGRAYGIAVMIIIMTIGTAMMATCQNVQTYCAAQVFYNIGSNCLSFSITLFVVDTSPLRNRAFLMGFTSSPSIITNWLHGPISESILNVTGFRWGFGIWCIAVPAVFTPLLSILFVYERRAIRQGLLTRPVSHRRWYETIYHYGTELDVIGLLLSSSGLGLLLLAVSLYSYQPGEWRSPMIVCFFIFGGLLLLCFLLYEKFLAPSTFISWSLLTDKTVISTNVMMLFMEMGQMLWSAYFYSMLIVVYRRPITQASYINNIYFIGSTAWMLLIGVAVRHYGRIKIYALSLGIPLIILGAGLMIKWRTPESSIGYIVMCQVFIAIGSGTMYPIEQLTLMAVSSHQHIAALLAIESLVASIGKSVGSAISAAIWTGTFPKRLAEYLPTSSLPDLAEIYGSLEKQNSYKTGSPERRAITHAYGDSQMILLITSICLLSVAMVATTLWKDINVKTAS